MNLWSVTEHRTTPEEQDVAPGDLDLNLRDVMLDLDPGMLAWTPPRTRWFMEAVTSESDS